MAWIMSRNKNITLENMMRYSSECLMGAERGFFRWRFLEVKVKGEGEQWNWRFKVSGLDRINGIYRIG